jgi:MerR family transcriptional regulator/heat shock protein HspR
VDERQLMDERTAVFIISVAARLVAMHPSTLRKYEVFGLLEPCRQSGRLRLYSLEDLARLQQIKLLVDERGVNLAGVKLALELTEKAQRVYELATDSAESPGDSHEILRLAEEILELLGARRPNAATRASSQPGRAAQ